MGLWPWKMPD
jgi:ferritin-like metal-binding protein YciE